MHAYTTQNTTVNVTFVKEDVSKGQVMAVGLRSKKSDDAWAGSYCQGYEKMLCNAQAKSLKKVKLEFHVSGTSVPCSACTARGQGPGPGFRLGT